jgi:hypothetical protein
MLLLAAMVGCIVIAIKVPAGEIKEHEKVNTESLKEKEIAE